jgi:poly(A) polymerase Pap1
VRFPVTQEECQSREIPAAEIVDHIMVNKAEWSELFTKHDFFHKYKYYLMVIASSGDPEIQTKWYNGSLIDESH